MSTTNPPQTRKNKPRSFPEHIPVLVDYLAIFHYYGLFKNTTTKLVMTNDFVPIVKIGRKNYFRSKDVEKWIEDKSVK